MKNFSIKKALLFFMLTMISSITFTPQTNETAMAKMQYSIKKGSINSTYFHVQKNKGKLYLKNSAGKTGYGWYIKFKAGLLPLSSLDDLKLYPKNSFSLSYANSKGILKANEHTKNHFYFNKKGYLADSTGLYKIRGHYYFLKDGKLQTKEITYKKKKYYTNINGTVCGFKKGNQYYSPQGKKLSAIQKRDFQTRIYAREIISGTVKTSMTKNQRLQACFLWVVHHYSYVDIKCHGEKGWTSSLGMTMLKRGIGDCRGLAVGFAYLASEAGFKNTYLCQDSKNIFSGSHCWTSVDGRYYDPLFYNAKRPRRYLPVFNGSTPNEYYKKTHCTASQKFRPGE